MLKSATLLSILMISLVLCSQNRDFSQFEITKAERNVLLNGAYPTENSKV